MPVETETSSRGSGRGDLQVDKLRVSVVTGPDAGLERESIDGRLSIGVADDATLRLTDPTVSRYHLELEAVRDGVLVRDLGSKNGTMLGPTLIREAVLRETTELSLGDSRVQIVLGGERVTVPVSKAMSFGGLIGGSVAMRRVYAALEQAAPTPAPVLILGESGTGKELAARAVHAVSQRATQPFEVVDCGGLSPTLVESELFGYERGSFTGADRDRAGAFERADGGTLFLDELGELPLEVQPKLLRVLGEREVRRVGGARPRKVDVRIVAATNRDLRREINAGKFRADLYYRLAVIQVHLPPLRDRLEDLPMLVRSLLEAIEPDVGPVNQLDIDTTQLYSHGWPGNVRELRNYLQQVAVLRAPPPLSSPDGDGFDSQGADRLLPLHKALDRFERTYVTRLLERTGNNVAEAARISGVNRATMYRIIQRHGMKLEP